MMNDGDHNTLEDFKIKYNYFIFGLRLLFFLFFLTLLFSFIFFAGPQISTGGNLNFKLFIGLLAGLFLAFFLAYRFGKLLLTQRIVIKLQNGKLIKSDALLKKEDMISVEDIKGFSLTTYPTKVWDFKEITIYLNNGDKIELPQFLYWNFKDIKKTLELNNIKFLGTEPFRWRFLDRRHYHFE